MSDPVAETLSRFTPDASGLDRDALLFAAGRASARPPRRWAVLAGALAASQLVTLALLLLQSARTVPPTPPAPAPFVDKKSAPPDEPPPAGRGDASLWALREQSFATEGDLPPRPAEPFAPAEPPLRAFADPPAALLQ